MEKATAVGSFIMADGDGDPAASLRNNSYSMRWGSRNIKKFREIKPVQKREDGLALPTLYLHFLPQEFRIDRGGICQSLRAGNDMSEVVMKLPSEYLSEDFAANQCGGLTKQVQEVQNALRSQGEILVKTSGVSDGSADPGARFFSLKAARAKAGVSLDKPAFGIPEKSNQYLFVNNHASVVHFDDSVREAFNECIGNLAEEGAPAKKFSIFLKVFYEGGFGYNEKQPMGQNGYLPVNQGVAAMSTVPAFEGQIGIGTGYPYELPAAFLPFVETVPISIDAIKSMSDRHGRYGLTFTRVVWVWEGDKFESEATLDFCSICPHGAFFYVPEKLSDHQRIGGYVYAFGESKDTGNEALSQSEAAQD